MTSSTVESRPWSARRWWSSVLIVFAVQVGLVFWLGDRSSPVPRKGSGAPAFRYSQDRPPELLELEDPTLFALPHLDCSSALARLDQPAPESPAPDWPEPARFLAPPVSEWGAALKKFVSTSPPPSLPPVVRLEPPPRTSKYFSIAPPPRPSTLHVEGDLAGRPLLDVPPLRCWTNSDLLTNSVVQLLVDARGYPVSAVLLAPSGASSRPQRLADEEALTLARDTRFEAQRTSTATGLSVGTLIFEWQTILEPSTNSASPPP